MSPRDLQRWHWKLPTLALVLTVIIAACSDQGPDDDDDPDPGLRLAANVVQLDLIAGVQLTRIEGGLEITGPAPAIVAGDILVSEQLDGVVEEVISVATADDGLRVETDPASVDDLFESGTLEIDFPLYAEGDGGPADDPLGVDLDGTTLLDVEVQGVRATVVANSGQVILQADQRGTTGRRIGGQQSHLYYEGDVDLEIRDLELVLTTSGGLDDSMAHEVVLHTRPLGSVRLPVGPLARLAWLERELVVFARGRLSAERAGSATVVGHHRQNVHVRVEQIGDGDDIRTVVDPRETIQDFGLATGSSELACELELEIGVRYEARIRVAARDESNLNFEVAPLLSFDGDLVAGERYEWRIDSRIAGQLTAGFLADHDALTVDLDGDPVLIGQGSVPLDPVEAELVRLLAMGGPGSSTLPDRLESPSAIVAVGPDVLAVADFGDEGEEMKFLGADGTFRGATSLASLVGPEDPALSARAIAGDGGRAYLLARQSGRSVLQELSSSGAPIGGLRELPDDVTDDLDGFAVVGSRLFAAKFRRLEVYSLTDPDGPPQQIWGDGGVCNIPGSALCAWTACVGGQLQYGVFGHVVPISSDRVAVAAVPDINTRAMSFAVDGTFDQCMLWDAQGGVTRLALGAGDGLLVVAYRQMNIYQPTVSRIHVFDDRDGTRLVTDVGGPDESDVLDPRSATVLEGGIICVLDVARGEVVVYRL